MGEAADVDMQLILTAHRLRIDREREAVFFRPSSIRFSKQRARLPCGSQNRGGKLIKRIILDTCYLSGRDKNEIVGTERRIEKNKAWAGICPSFDLEAWVSGAEPAVVDGTGLHDTP